MGSRKEGAGSQQGTRSSKRLCYNLLLPPRSGLVLPAGDAWMTARPEGDKLGTGFESLFKGSEVKKSLGKELLQCTANVLHECGADLETLPHTSNRERKTIAKESIYVVIFGIDAGTFKATMGDPETKDRCLDGYYSGLEGLMHQTELELIPSRLTHYTKLARGADSSADTENILTEVSRGFAELCGCADRTAVVTYGKTLLFKTLIGVRGVFTEIPQEDVGEGQGEVTEDSKDYYDFSNAVFHIRSVLADVLEDDGINEVVAAYKDAVSDTSTTPFERMTATGANVKGVLKRWLADELAEDLSKKILYSTPRKIFRPPTENEQFFLDHIRAFESIDDGEQAFLLFPIEVSSEATNTTKLRELKDKVDSGLSKAYEEGGSTQSHVWRKRLVDVLSQKSGTTLLSTFLLFWAQSVNLDLESEVKNREGPKVSPRWSAAVGEESQGKIETKAWQVVMIIIVLALAVLFSLRGD